MTRNELLNRISAKELRDWEVFAAVEPFGEERADLRSAIIAFTVAQCMGQKKDKSSFRLDEFLASRYYEPPRQQSTESMKLFFRGISAGQK